jgi:hypothetical protein
MGGCMRWRHSLLPLLLPLCVSAQEHGVPIGTQGNRFLFSIRNTRSLPLHDVQVAIQSAPEWLSFETGWYRIDSIPPNAVQDAEFLFRVMEGEAGRIGKVLLVIRDKDEKTIAAREVLFRTELSSNETRLYPPFPNPANPATTIRYTLREQAHVKIDIYNVLGQKVCSLLDKDQAGGQWSLVWDGKDGTGQRSASGMYLIQLETDVKGTVNHQTLKVLLGK